MGSGISMSEREIDAQENYVRRNFTIAKANIRNKNDYSDHQIEMKLRDDYYRTSYNGSYYKDNYVCDSDWYRNGYN